MRIEKKSDVPSAALPFFSFEVNKSNMKIKDELKAKKKKKMQIANTSGARNDLNLLNPK